MFDGLFRAAAQSGFNPGNLMQSGTNILNNERQINAAFGLQADKFKGLGSLQADQNQANLVSQAHHFAGLQGLQNQNFQQFEKNGLPSYLALLGSNRNYPTVDYHLGGSNYFNGGLYGANHKPITSAQQWIQGQGAPQAFG